MKINDYKLKSIFAVKFWQNRLEESCYVLIFETAIKNVNFKRILKQKVLITFLVSSEIRWNISACNEFTVISYATGHFKFKGPNNWTWHTKSVLNCLQYHWFWLIYSKPCCLDSHACYELYVNKIILHNFGSGLAKHCIKWDSVVHRKAGMTSMFEKIPSFLAEH